MNKVYNKAEIVFFRWKWLIAQIIMKFSGKPYSHVGIQVWPNYYEARWNQWIINSKILKVWHWSHYHKRQTIVDIMVIPWKFEIEWLEKQVWKAYDFPWILSYIFTKVEHDPNRWYCSELVYQLLIHAWILKETTKLPSPTAIFNILIDKGYKIDRTEPDIKLENKNK